jgi:hypothetical protein
MTGGPSLLAFEQVTLTNLEHAYQSVSFGYIEPDTIEGSATTLANLATMIVSNMKKDSSRELVKLQYGRFNAAIFVTDDRLPLGVLHFYPRQFQNEARYHAWVYFGQGEMQSDRSQKTS